MKLLMIGLGSPNENDQIGWILIDELEKQQAITDATFFKSKSDGSDWFHEIKNHQQIIFIDAVLSNEPIGSLVEININDLNKIPHGFKSSSHTISLSDSLELARNLNLLNVPVRIIGVSIGQEVNHKNVSYKALKRIPELLKTI